MLKVFLVHTKTMSFLIEFRMNNNELKASINKFEPNFNKIVLAIKDLT